MDMYHATWRTRPGKYLATTYDLEHLSQRDLDQYHDSPFHARAPDHQRTVITAQPLYRLGDNPSHERAMSTAIMCTGCRPTIDFRQNWNSAYEITSSDPFKDNDSNGTAASTNMQICQEFQTPSQNSPVPFDTLDPRKTLRQFKPCSFVDPISQYLPNTSQLDQSYQSPPDDYDSSLYGSTAYQEQNLFHEEDGSPPITESFINSPSSKHNEEENIEKPYAKLIHEALMQAPGYKMTLRDIYEWFMVKTTKPQESSGMGWQNSIRHNLSMNQAFENDRSNSSLGRGHSRKANSVWMLTDHAVKNGVQSTTRYRKQGLGKRSVSNRSPAIERQRSGAKGGRATRKCAIRIKKEDDMTRTSNLLSAIGDISSFQASNIGTGVEEARLTPRAHYVQPTPTPDDLLQSEDTMPAYYYHNDEQLSDLEHYDNPEQETYLYDALFSSYSDPNWDEITKIESE